MFNFQKHIWDAILCNSPYMYMSYMSNEFGGMGTSMYIKIILYIASKLYNERMNSQVDIDWWWEQSSAKILATWLQNKYIPEIETLSQATTSSVLHIISYTHCFWHLYQKNNTQKTSGSQPSQKTATVAVSPRGEQQQPRWRGDVTVRGAIELDQTVGCSCGIPYSVSDPCRSGPLVYNLHHKKHVSLKEI